MKNTYLSVFFIFNLLITNSLSINSAPLSTSLKMNAKAAGLVFLSNLEADDAFEVWINDVPQALKSYTSIRIQQIPTPFCKVKIVFNKNSLRTIVQTLYLKGGMEYIYEIGQDKSKQTFLSYQSEYRGVIGKKMMSPKSAASFVMPKETIKYSVLKADSSFLIKDFLVSKTPTPKITNKKKEETDLQMVANIIEEEDDLTISFLSKEEQVKLPKKNALTKGKLIDKAQKNNQKKVKKNNAQEITILTKKVKASDFESEKRRLIKKFISSEAITNQELINVLKLLEFERTRLDVAKFAFFFVQDTNNFQELEKAFELEQTAKKWKVYVKKATKQMANIKRRAAVK